MLPGLHSYFNGCIISQYISELFVYSYIWDSLFYPFLASRFRVLWSSLVPLFYPNWSAFPFSNIRAVPSITALSINSQMLLNLISAALQCYGGKDLVSGQKSDF